MRLRKDGVMKNVSISIPMKREDRDLIDRAAAALGKSRSEFVVEAACREAQTTILDQTVFHVDGRTWKATVRHAPIYGCVQPCSARRNGTADGWDFSSLI